MLCLNFQVSNFQGQVFVKNFQVQVFVFNFQAQPNTHWELFVICGVSWVSWLVIHLLGFKLSLTFKFQHSSLTFKFQVKLSSTNLTSTKLSKSTNKRTYQLVFKKQTSWKYKLMQLSSAAFKYKIQNTSSTNQRYFPESSTCTRTISYPDDTATLPKFEDRQIWQPSLLFLVILTNWL